MARVAWQEVRRVLLYDADLLARRQCSIRYRADRLDPLHMGPGAGWSEAGRKPAFTRQAMCFALSVNALHKQYHVQVHHDLKAKNFVRFFDGRYCLVDFDNCRTVDKMDMGTSYVSATRCTIHGMLFINRCCRGLARARRPCYKYHWLEVLGGGIRYCSEERSCALSRVTRTR